MSLKISDFITKINEQIFKITDLINGNASDNAKRMFIIDNKTTLDNISNTILKVINAFDTNNVSEEDRLRVLELQESFDKTKKEIFDSLLSIDKEDTEEVSQDLPEINATINVVTVSNYHVFISGNIYSMKNASREELNQFINDLVDKGSNPGTLVVIEGGVEKSFTTKIVV